MNRGFMGALRVMLVLGVALAGSSQSRPVWAQGQMPEPTAKFDAAHRVEFPSLLPPTQLQGYLFKPEGAGPFPAVVMGHGCSGVDSPYAGPRRWVDRMVSWGYVVLKVDSYTTRGGKTCVDGKADDALRAADAYAGLKFLATQPIVDARRVGAINWGEGGVSIFSAMESSPSDRKTPNLAAAKLDALSGLRFRGATVVYPETCFSEANFYAPVLWLVGENGISRAMAACVREAKKLAAVGVPISLQVYPNATLSFDLEHNGYSPGGDPIRYDPAATADAAERVKQFLADNLK